MRVLVVEDDAALRDTLRTGLRAAGFDVTAVGLGADAVREADRYPPDVAVVDVNLPDDSGFVVCVRLKERGVMVIILTVRTAVDDRLHGFEVGADDYLGKPFVLGELVARIHAVSRRAQAFAPRHLRVGSVTVDLAALRAKRGGEPLDLTRREMDLLVYLMRNAGHVLTRDQILAHVWGYDSEVSDGVLEVYVGYLRRKLESKGPRILETIRGVGYRLQNDAP